MNITEDELTLLANCTSDEEWNAACDKIKKERGGAYPPDWSRVKLSGLMDDTVAKWGSTTELKIIRLR